MIIDHIKNANRYFNIDNELEKIFEKLKVQLIDSDIEIDSNLSKRSSLSIQKKLPLRDRMCLYEYHNNHFDIHLCMEGEEIIEYSTNAVKIIDESTDKDFTYAEGNYAGEVCLSKGMFALYFDGEMHKPLLGKPGEYTTKCVVKIEKSNQFK